MILSWGDWTDTQKKEKKNKKIKRRKHSDKGPVQLSKVINSWDAISSRLLMFTLYSMYTNGLLLKMTLLCFDDPQVF